MRRSALALQPYFYRMACVCEPAALAQTGRDAERAMLAATGGANAHKGAVWTLGLMVSAAAQHPGDATDIANTAAEIAASVVALNRPNLVSHGDIVAQRYGVSGARGEALAGFPHVVEVGLPMLRSRRAAGCDESIGRLDALLAIMAQLDDTCVLYRGGLSALNAAKNGAASVITAGGYATPFGRAEMQRLDGAMLGLHVSPGGSADLLAATIFLDAVERGLDEIAEDSDGTA
jgi:triphosphoribosyl-dephospho-CoA synthase